jgi:mannose-6-phosphate isomerase-like protein (cupin superfamily)
LSPNALRGKTRFVTTGDHLHDVLTGQHVTILQTSRDTDGKLLQLEVRLDPGGWVPLHVHVRQDERVEVLEGSLTVRVAGKEQLLGVGDSADVPRRRMHTVRNAGDRDVRFLMEARPARHLEEAMRAMFGVLGLLRPLARLRRGR